MRYQLNKRFIFFQVPPYRKQRFRSLTVIGLLCLSLVFCYYIVDFRIRPTLRHLAGAKAKVIATQAINEAIRSNISPDIKYQNLINIQLNSEGKVALIQPNTGEINRISSEATLAVQKRLQDLPKLTIKIPMGQVVGSKFEV